MIVARNHSITSRSFSLPGGDDDSGSDELTSVEALSIEFWKPRLPQQRWLRMTSSTSRHIHDTAMFHWPLCCKCHTHRVSMLAALVAVAMLLYFDAIQALWSISSSSVSLSLCVALCTVLCLLMEPPSHHRGCEACCMLVCSVAGLTMVDS
jgi:hypothetical protein